MGENTELSSAPPSFRSAPTIPPADFATESNWLSGAPSATGALSVGETAFFDALVTPGDLSAVFQPIVDVKNGALFAYETLVRCRLPELSPPALFKHASALRSTGRLGRMIREIALPLCGGVPLFVNLHPEELEERWLVQPDDPIFSHDHDIYLEITESAPLTHPDLCMRVLRDVCSRSGAHLVVDDLGAGYSNLKLIADLEPKVVKLDRALVQDLHRSARQRKLVTMIVRLCEALDASVVAEGIETVDELGAVIDAGVHYGQGYLLARPGFPPPAATWPDSSGALPLPRA